MKQILKRACGGIVKSPVFVENEGSEEIVVPLGAGVVMSKTAPPLQPHEYRNVKIGKNTTVTIDLEDIKVRMKVDFYKASGLSITVGDA